MGEPQEIDAKEIIRRISSRIVELIEENAILSVSNEHLRRKLEESRKESRE